MYHQGVIHVVQFTQNHSDPQSLTYSANPTVREYSRKSERQPPGDNSFVRSRIKYHTNKALSEHSGAGRIEYPTLIRV